MNELYDALELEALLTVCGKDLALGPWPWPWSLARRLAEHVWVIRWQDREPRTSGWMIRRADCLNMSSLEAWGPPILLLLISGLVLSATFCRDEPSASSFPHSVLHSVLHSYSLGES